MSFDHAGMIPDLRAPSKRQHLRTREMDFNVTAKHAPLPTYKPMFDAHLEHLWVNPRIRHTMQKAGFLDDEGKPVDVDAHRRKLYVIEQELAQANQLERSRIQDKEIQMQAQWTLQQREAAFQMHISHVNAVRDSRRKKREMAAMGATGSRSLGNLSMRSAGEAIAGGGSSQAQIQMGQTFS
eukprot:TRINITY_DN14500_c0_g2_i4.p1 TRINITY_DN14500_c0_g2~~TRINITY_DN14500_c0_g2_i4.p1  ORF type:complete len:182 (+),score=31.95 TRINITY_DN14500_c0_g2_i4:68-613(+)